MIGLAFSGPHAWVDALRRPFSHLGRRYCPIRGVGRSTTRRRDDLVQGRRGDMSAAKAPASLPRHSSAPPGIVRRALHGNALYGTMPAEMVTLRPFHLCPLIEAEYTMRQSRRRMR